MTQTFSGNKALCIEEPLLFEFERHDQTGVDVEKVEIKNTYLGSYYADHAHDIPGLSEPQAMRHYVRLSQKNYAIDTGLFPLGSCTMKHNPRLNEAVARLPGFADIHPLAPLSSVQGALQLMQELSGWLLALTGMDAISLSPKAGAHGEICGLSTIRKALQVRGEDKKRRRIITTDSAHGTNPATAVTCGFDVDTIKVDASGVVKPEQVEEKLGPDLAGIMLTNPNTCGLYETYIERIAAQIHKAGGYFYCDGANLNAIIGKISPGALGIDAMHINLHKTFSTPHGGGGPGSGPTVFSQRLAAYVPFPQLVEQENMLVFDEEDKPDERAGRLAAFYGQMGMFVRALTYILSNGKDGLRQVAEDAVLSANYVQTRLATVMSKAYPGRSMHETLFTDSFLKKSGVSTLDFAKATIDEGFHPMTVFFPLVVSGAMLIEPTETESKQELDRYCDALIALANHARTPEAKAWFAQAPRSAPRKRLDEAMAARKPRLSHEG